MPKGVFNRENYGSRDNVKSITIFVFENNRVSSYALPGVLIIAENKKDRQVHETKYTNDAQRHASASFHMKRSSSVTHLTLFKEGYKLQKLVVPQLRVGRLYKFYLERETEE